MHPRRHFLKLFVYFWAPEFTSDHTCRLCYQFLYIPNRKPVYFDCSHHLSFKVPCRIEAFEGLSELWTSVFSVRVSWRAAVNNTFILKTWRTWAKAGRSVFLCAILSFKRTESVCNVCGVVWVGVEGMWREVMYFLTPISSLYKHLSVIWLNIPPPSPPLLSTLLLFVDLTILWSPAQASEDRGGILSLSVFCLFKLWNGHYYC